MVIENKPAARDPEGEVIFKDLVMKGAYTSVKGVRSGKYLRLQVIAENGERAKRIVSDVCNDLRIFNPVIHECRIIVQGTAT